LGESIWVWVGFIVFVLAMLAIDLGVFNRKAHVVLPKEAARWSIITLVLAMVFAAGIAWGWLPVGVEGKGKALEFLTGYLIELALSVDNIFVFVLLFSYFKVPPKYQHRVLFWGVLGALVMRGLMIWGGSLLLSRFHWVIYLFGAFLVFTGIRMAMQDEMDIEPESNPALKLVRRFFPVTPHYHGQHFFIKEEVAGKLRQVATPLFVVLVLVETTDLIFAVDSIPAIFAVTRDPFLVFSSNVFAILCLRSLYFLLAGVIERFYLLKLGLSAVLVFIGIKMLVSGMYHIPVAISLAVVALLLGASVAGSLMFPKEGIDNPQVTHDPLDESDDPVRPILPDDRDSDGRADDDETQLFPER